MALTIRRLTRSELEIAVGWAETEGWAPGDGDADAFYTTDPEGFLGVFVNNQLVASLSAVVYDRSYGFLGFYMVRPEWRGRGFGLRLWHAGMAYLDGVRTIGLDGVLKQQDVYRRAGFVPAYHTSRYSGVIEAKPVQPSSALGVELLSGFSFDEVLAYDVRHFPVSRRKFLDSWLHYPSHIAYGLRRNGRLAGYGCLRSAAQGLRIGPLFADDADAASALMDALVEAAVGQRLFIDIPEVNRAASSLMSRLGLTPIFETVRMYAGPLPALPRDRIFGVTSLELG
ncbi:GNAT family N-acetyltransferase [Azospirillaceae bacterium]